MYNRIFDKYMHCEMITIVITIITDISITSNSYVLKIFLWREHLRSTVLANFKYTLLLNIITVLYIRPLELTHTIRESLHHLLNIPHYPHPPWHPEGPRARWTRHKGAPCTDSIATTTTRILWPPDVKS